MKDPDKKSSENQRTRDAGQQQTATINMFAATLAKKVYAEFENRSLLQRRLPRGAQARQS